MKKLLMIAAMAMFATVACGEKDNGGDKPVVLPKATIVAAPTSVAIDAAGAFNVTLDKAATEDVTIAVANAGEATLTVAAAEIKITKGATTGSIAFTGKAEGSAKVTFTTTSKAIELVTKELTVTVTKDKPEPPVGPVYSYPEAGNDGTYGAITNVVIGAKDHNLMTMDIASDEFVYWNFLVTEPSPIVTGDKLVVKFDIGKGYGSAEGSGAADAYVIDAYIDWNNDGKFDGANESLGKESFTGHGDKVKEYPLTIPADAAALSRIRVIYAFDGKDVEAYEPNSFFDTGAVAEFMYSIAK